MMFTFRHVLRISTVFLQGLLACCCFFAFLSNGTEIHRGAVPASSESTSYSTKSYHSDIYSLRGIGNLFWDVIHSTKIWSGHSDELFTDFVQHSYQPWLCSILASLTIGFSGILPLFIIPIGTGKSSVTHGVEAQNLRLLLSFAVGSLLGDVFLHLLPEAWNHMYSVNSPNGHAAHLTIGLWILTGIFTFIIVEKMFDKTEDKEDAIVVDQSKVKGALTNGFNGSVKRSSNGSCCFYPSEESFCETYRSDYRSDGYTKLKSTNLSTQSTSKLYPKNTTNGYKAELVGECRSATGYLNLLANSIDNFTHGLAVAGSFLVSFKMGVITTFAILIHEIPHEIGDFAILLKSGFNRREAAKAQLATAVVGIGGAIAALSAETTQEMGVKTAWILPFTAGGFLNIALVNVLPDILQEKDPGQSLKQLCCLLCGIVVMGLVTVAFE